LEESWKLSDANDLVALRDATGTTNRMPVPLRNAAAEVLGRRLAGAAPAADDVLTKLADKKFVTLSGVAGSPTPAPSEIFGDAARTLVIGGPAVAIPDDLVPAVVGGVIAGGAKVAVAQAFVATEEVTERASWIDSIANADALRGRVSTIDDEERTEGRVASTLALAELGTGAAGNYGLGRDRAVPDKVVTVPTAR
ncbi:MAG: copper transporter, partial [Acidimicrobiia bacterium]